MLSLQMNLAMACVPVYEVDFIYAAQYSNESQWPYFDAGQLAIRPSNGYQGYMLYSRMQGN